MRFSWTLLVAAAGLACASPVPYSQYKIHESRKFLPHGWERVSRLGGDLLLPVKIGLTQANLHRGEELLLQVSHPESPSYGKHWTQEQVREMFSPSDESYAAVARWLRASEISYSLDARGWITFNATVSKVEDILRTKYYLYEHTSGQMHLGCEAYSLPEEVQNHVDIILPTLHWDNQAEDTESPKQKMLRRLAKRSESKRHINLGPILDSIGTGFRSSGTRRVSQTDRNCWNKFNRRKYGDLSTCDQFITPNCLRQLYNFDENTRAVQGNSLGVVAVTPETYLQEDMDIFFANFSPALVGKAPDVKSIDGGYVLPLTGDWWNAAETNLDLQYTMSLVYPQNVTLFQVGDGLQTNEWYNNFLDAIDGSYCTSGGGDDPSKDDLYPDPLAGGYKGQKMCGTYDPTLVISLSFGGNEADYTTKYATRQCNEFLKLGLMGVSVIFGSGDFGVAGYAAVCRNANGTYNDGTSGRFTPDYPATCPYITAVGGTYIPLGNTVFDKEVAWNTFLPWMGINGSSGGGFSETFPVPQYQSGAVNSYLRMNPPPYTAAQWDKTSPGRGFPDVSANAWNYTEGIEGVLDLIGGTSASTPTFSAIVTLLNQDRLSRNKSPLGFLNPAFYANPSMFNDITVGNNPGCGTNGFKASVGWDPVTGLGTPNFGSMRNYFAFLP
ncbi:Aorsin [Arthrobotrys entomopaga]|nr:Aorsin [Arthrobotrys entomopaga]